MLVGIAFAAQAGFALWLRLRVEAVIAAAGGAGRELAMLAGVLELVESREFDSQRLRRTVAELRSDGTAPSAVVRRLQHLLVLLDSRRNQFFAPLAMLLMWGTQLSMAVEAWRATHGPAIARWITAIGEFEALNSLGGYCYERPDEPFPVIHDDGAHRGGQQGAQEGALFRGQQVGHPLLPRAECVVNDVTLDAETRLLIVSGSNMSGKSTLMRAVGTNVALALAGAPVRARRLELSCLQVGGTLRVEDSLRRGMSGFYSEIHRFLQLVRLAERQPPLLFLLEEILNTTNSHDRRAGARAVIGSLLQRGAIGLVTTHDLAITEIAEHVEHARNVHFVDHLEGDEIHFDYVLRPGVVGKSNAVDLMRSIGLDV